MSEDAEIDFGLESRLLESGYKVIRPIGSGHTRDVFEVEIVSDGPIAGHRRVLKIPKTVFDNDSVTTRLNLTRGDLNAREVSRLKDVSSQHIVNVHDAFGLDDGRTITVEEFFDALSLEDLVETLGPITDPKRFSTIFSGAVRGLVDLYSSGLIHRDIKPSNILVGKGSLFSKLTDLQNVGPYNSNEVMLPTRGGTAYTHPLILNALMQGEESRCSVVTELYALGATMYYTLTGERLFERELKPGESDTLIYIDEEPVQVILTDEGKSVCKIIGREHDSFVKKRLKKIPRKYRKMLRGLLLIEGIAHYGSPYASVLDKLEKIAKPRLIDWDYVRAQLPFTGLALGAAFGVVLGISYLENRGELPVETTWRDVLRARETYGLTDAVIDPMYNEELDPYFEEVLSLGEKNLPRQDERWLDVLSPSLAFRGVGERRMSALFVSIGMEDPDRLIEHFGSSRTSVNLIPYEFLFSVCQPEDPCRDDVNEGLNLNQEVGFGGWYMKHAFYLEDDLAGLYSRYICSDGSLAKAKEKAGTDRYFKSYQGGFMHQGVLVDGYARHLPAIERDIISRALVLYQLMDNSGEVHLGMFDQRGNLIEGYLDRPAIEYPEISAGRGVYVDSSQYRVLQQDSK
jgi:serine/threonine protein kinase